MTFRLPESKPLPRPETKAPEPGTLEYELDFLVGRHLKVYALVDAGVSTTFEESVAALNDVANDSELLDDALINSSSIFVNGIRDQVGSQQQQRLKRTGRLSVDDESASTGTRDYLIELEDRPIYEAIFSQFLDLKSEITTRSDSLGEFREAITVNIKDQIARIVRNIFWLYSESGIIQKKNRNAAETEVDIELLQNNPRILSTISSIRTLSAVLVNYAENPEEAFLLMHESQRQSLTEGFEASLRKRLTEAYNAQQEVVRVEKQVRKRGAQVIGIATTTDLSPDPEKETDLSISTNAAESQSATAEQQIHYMPPKDIEINSRWQSTETVTAEVITVQLGDVCMPIVHDCDPALSSLAEQTRKQHAGGKSSSHPLDRIMLLKAKGYLTGANPVVYNGSGTDKIIKRRERSEAYKDIEIRYAGNSKSPSVLRVYYSVTRQADVLKEPYDPDGNCLVVYAETDKEHEPTVLQRITGRGMKQLRRGM